MEVALTSKSADKIMTVLGPVSPNELGPTAMHEHLIADCSFSGNDPQKKFDEEDAAVEEMKDLVRAGAGTIVECSCHGLLPDYEALVRIAKASGINIIASTGFYRRIVYPEFVLTSTAEEIARQLIEEVEEGIGGTGVRPGMLAEFASHDDGEPDEHVEKVWRAAARTQLATGLPITTHCWVGNGAEWEIGILREEGVDLAKVVIGHVGANRPDMDKARWILDTGVNVGVDCIGYDERAGFVDYFDPERAELIKTFIGWGHLSQITISRDMMRRYELKRHGGKGYSYLFEGFVDILRKAGICEKEIRMLLVENPHRILSCKRP